MEKTSSELKHASAIIWHLAWNCCSKKFLDLCQIDDITDYALFFSKWKTTKIYIDIIIYYITAALFNDFCRKLGQGRIRFFLHHSTLWVFSNFTKGTSSLFQVFSPTLLNSRLIPKCIHNQQLFWKQKMITKQGEI